MARQKNNTEKEKIEMTQERYKELLEELERRKTVDREIIAAEISDARELGDLSENHAYTIAMEKKEMNENRIKDLESLMKVVTIVKGSSSSTLVTIGSTVTILNLKNNSKKKVSLVGSEETEAADPLSGKISIDSPIGKALNNSKVGDIVDVVLPSGVIEFKVLSMDS